jgi:photosystem II stability/assembly factor-like uncharacterized protein
MKIFMFFCLLFFAHVLWAKHVPQSSAQQIAVTFYQFNNPSGKMDPQIKSVSVKSRDNVSTFYIFRFVSGGFVLVAADDASIPILGYSFEDDMPEIIDNPALTEWLDGYSREIGQIITQKLNNSETLNQWSAIQNGRTLTSPSDVLPLLTTAWDQGCYYNEMCPTDPEGPCSHAPTGCVATAMAQIMKFHNFPPRGVSQHIYNCPPYGQQTADFENTTYDWSAMPDTVAGSNNAVAALNYHAGVSVDMAYSATGSGADGSIVPAAFLNYFNYSPEIGIAIKSSFPDVEDFKSMLRVDLDAHLPICYGGFDAAINDGHMFVCDGYHMSDGTFHFNWGWAGYANGYYAIGNLNPGIYHWDNDNIAVVHIKPYNPDLIVRITHPVDNAVANVNDTVVIKASVVRGSANLLKIFIDDVEKSTTTVDSISFAWNITSNDLGSHIVKAYAYNSTDTVYYKESLNVSEWVTQASRFSSENTPVYYLSAVDSNIVWGSTVVSSEYTRTVNGGTAWTPGLITNSTGLVSAMIFGMDSLKAYALMVKMSGNDSQGIYMTVDGGTTWVHQVGTIFTNPNSYPDIVHFFNTNDGVTMGDPVNGEFEIYTTTDGGNVWSQVAGSNIPDPLSNEWGIIGYYSAIHDTIWAGTSEGRVYRSVNKGLNWTVSTAPGMSGKLVKPTFRNGSHGLLLDGTYGTGLLCETFDGGETWTQVNYTGSNFHTDIAYVPGTPNTWVRSGADIGSLGCAYSFDGGHTWTDFLGTSGTPYLSMAWANRHCGWAGGYNTSATEGGVYKFIGQLAFRPSPENVQATADNNSVDLTWEEPAYDPAQMSLLGYNIMRDGTRINASLVNGLAYTDQNAPTGVVTYCVSAMYDIGESQGSCKSVEVAVGIMHPGDQQQLLIYPNPAHGSVTVTSSGQKGEIMLYDQRGRVIPMSVRDLSTDLTSIDISNISAGIYLITLKTTEGISRTKLVVY